VRRVHERISPEGEPVRDHRCVGVEYVIPLTLEETGKLPGEGVLVPHASMAYLVEDLRLVARRPESGAEVIEDPLDRTVPRRRYRLDPSSDEENSHALPRSP
jgi:hypothetical protein